MVNNNMKKKCLKKITFNSVQTIKTFKKDEPSNKLSDEHTEPMYHSPVSISRVSSPVCKTKKKRSPTRPKQVKSDSSKNELPKNDSLKPDPPKSDSPKPDSPKNDIKKDEKKKSPNKIKKSPNKNKKKSPRKTK